MDKAINLKGIKKLKDAVLRMASACHKPDRGLSGGVAGALRVLGRTHLARLPA